MFEILAMTELFCTSDYSDVNLVGESGDRASKKELRDHFLWSFRHG